jgi:hypothetical protein
MVALKVVGTIVFSICIYALIRYIHYRVLLRMAEKLYIYAYPMVLMRQTEKITMQVFQTVPNQFFHMRDTPKYGFRYVVRPNLDTLYSVAWLDLSKEPVVLRVPDLGNRYFVLPILDDWTNVISSIGTRTLPTGAQEHQFVLVGPQYKIEPQSFQFNLIRVPTNIAWILGRIQTTGTTEDITMVQKLQDQFHLQTWTDWLQDQQKQIPETHAVTQKTKFVEALEASEASAALTPLEIVDEMRPKEFYDIFCKQIHRNEPKRLDCSVLDSLDSLKIRFDSPYTYLLNKAKANAQQQIKETSKTMGKIKNGWHYDLTLGNYKKRYLQRAAAAYAILGANLPEDAVYMTCRPATNETGRYVIHFEKSPPVNAFWSVTLYDKDGFLIQNEVNKYSIQGGNAAKNKDESIDIIISAKPEPPESNWLPLPSETDWNITLRLYWPKPEILNDEWMPPPIQ